MKKLLIIMMCIALVLPANVFAASSVTLGFDAAERNQDVAILPMYISDIPDGLTNISALTIHFTFDTSVLEFVELTDGSISSISNWYNHSEKNPNKVIVSWYDASSSNDNALTEANVGQNNPMFYATFRIIGELTEPSWINFESVSVHDYSSNKAENIVTKSGVVADITNDNNNSGDDSGANDGDGESGDGNIADEDVPAEGEDGENSGSAEDNNNSSSGSSSGDGGILRPSTGGGSSGGGNKKEEKPEVQTPPVSTETTTPEAAPKASEIFSDVADSHWAAASVAKLNQLGIVSGDNQKRANLNNKITRAETSKLALLINDKNVNGNIPLDVKDKNEIADWAKPYMATAIAEGIFSGYDDGTIRANNNITRAEMVAVIVKSLKLEVASDPALTFADNDAIGWAAPFVAKAVELGFVNGYEDNTFKPGKDITRAEAFAVFARVAEYLGK